MKYSEKKYPLQNESYQVIGICMEIHRILGKGLLEIVYKDAIEYEFNEKKIPYEREKKYEACLQNEIHFSRQVEYKGLILPHFFFADFVVFDKIILEVKAQKGIVDEHYSWPATYRCYCHRWVINYLAISKCPSRLPEYNLHGGQVGLIVNFGENSLITKRVIL